MPDFKDSIEVNASKQEIVDYVSNVENMSDYLPTVKEASMETEDRVHMRVNINGEDHEDTGFFRVVGDDRLEWGSEDHDYKGAMIFSGSGDTTNVSIELHINPPPALDKAMDENSGGEWPSKIQSGITNALRAIKTQVEASGTRR